MISLEVQQMTLFTAKTSSCIILGNKTILRKSKKTKLGQMATLCILEYHNAINYVGQWYSTPSQNMPILN